MPGPETPEYPMRPGGESINNFVSRNGLDPDNYSEVTQCYSAALNAFRLDLIMRQQTTAEDLHNSPWQEDEVA